MSHCIVTKLKGNVNNPNLPYLNGLRIQVIKSNNYVENNFTLAKINLTAGGKIITDSNHRFFIDDDSEGTNEYLANSNVDVKLKAQNDDYYIDVLNISNINILDASLTGSKNLRIDIEKFNTNGLQRLSAKNSEFFGKITKISRYTSLAFDASKISMDLDTVEIGANGYINTLTGDHVNVRGDIKNLAPLVKGTKVDLLISFNRCNVTGSLEELASESVRLGKNSKQIEIYASGGRNDVRYQNEKITRGYVIKFSPEYTNGYDIT